MIVFVRVGGSKTRKNRLHSELEPDGQTVEVQRLLTLGGPTAWMSGEGVGFTLSKLSRIVTFARMPDR